MNSIKIKAACLVLTLLYFFTSTIVPVYAAISYSYDANGNMTSDGTNCYVYNENNQLKQVKNCNTNQVTAQYYYDYQGTRMEKRQYTNGTISQTVYTPTKDYETKKLPDNTTQNTTYYHANGQIIARKNPDGSKTYYQDDHLGSTNLLTDQNGNTVENTTYYPYGEVKSGGTQSKYLYTGKEKDTETGLNYYASRYYSPHLQRFAQPDTLLPNIYDPQQLNRYTYARNNPLTYNDPTGHASSPFFSLLSNLFSSQPIVQAILIVKAIVTSPLAHTLTEDTNTLVSAFSNIGKNSPPSNNKPTVPTSQSSIQTQNNLIKSNTSGGESPQKASINPFQYAKDSGMNPRSPGENWVWKGGGVEGSPQGNYVNSITGEKIHLDLQHGEPKGPHINYTRPGGVPAKDSIDINLDGNQIDGWGRVIGEPINMGEPINLNQVIMNESLVEL